MPPLRIQGASQQARDWFQLRIQWLISQQRTQYWVVLSVYLCPGLQVKTSPPVVTAINRNFSMIELVQVVTTLLFTASIRSKCPFACVLEIKHKGGRTMAMVNDRMKKAWRNHCIKDSKECILLWTSRMIVIKPQNTISCNYTAELFRSNRRQNRDS